MDLWQGLLLISVVHWLAAASPGPDFVLASQQTLKHGRATGLWCSLGISLGLSVHIIYSVFGLAAVIASSEMLLWGIKILGGAYLIYLGIKGLSAKPATVTAIESDSQEPTPVWYKSLGLGVVCNVLNPKAPVYFVSLFTVVLSPDIPLYQLAIYGVWMMLIQLGWFSCVVLLLSRPKINAAFQRLGHWLDRILGGAMVLLGLKVLSSR